MIDTLRKKFIKISMLSVAIVLLAIYAVIGWINVKQTNERADFYTALILENGGTFPKWDRLPKQDEEKKQNPQENARDFFGGEEGYSIFGKERRMEDGIRALTPESEASTRFFTVWMDENGEVTKINMDSIASVTEENVKVYAKKVLEKGKERGWISNYRYRCHQGNGNIQIVFVDEHVSLAMTRNFMLILGGVFLGSMLGILTLLVFFSKGAVRPVAESYQKQKQFITDANHELKTPLTLILANLEILELEYGKNEWIEDMKTESMHMSELVNSLVSLSRMDEEEGNLEWEKMNLTEEFSAILAEFQLLAEAKGKKLHVELESEAKYWGDRQNMQQLLYILLDNAMKYCDEGGDIWVSLKKKRHLELRVENTFAKVENTEFKRLFDRFYREDKARTASESFGIGLSIAKAIVEKHKGEIRAYQAGKEKIGFVVVLKNKTGFSFFIHRNL